MQAREQAPERPSLRRRTYEVLEVGRGDRRLSTAVDTFIVVLILANVAAFALETVPSIEARFGPWFRWFELFSVTIFTIEYLARLWVCVEIPFLSRMTPLAARLQFARRPTMLIDLLAIAPFYLGSLIGLDLRVLRMLRLLRLLKLSRYSPAIHTLLRVLQQEARALAGAGLLLVMVLLLSATGMYYIEGSIQPDKLGSVPDAAYWAMTTLTTVGYGDVAPVTALGKLWAMLTMVVGLCILALPVAIIATGFAQEAGRHDFVVTWAMMSRIPVLASLDAASVVAVMRLLQTQSLPPHVEVIARGARSDSMYFIAAGRVVADDGETRRELNAGDYFGVTSMLHDHESRTRFATSSRCRLLKLHYTDFQRLEALHPEIGGRLRDEAAGEALATSKAPTPRTETT